jgi:hypothetical protein
MQLSFTKVNRIKGRRDLYNLVIKNFKVIGTQAQAVYLKYAVSNNQILYDALTGIVLCQHCKTADQENQKKPEFHHNKTDIFWYDALPSGKLTGR